MALADRVHVSRRFQRSIRIDTDLADPGALEGFICPQSSADVLMNMARHVTEDGQGAFTWTGPYGSGKSSLVVALSALLNGDSVLREHASSIVGEQTATAVWTALPPRKRGWRILPVVGRRGRPAQVVGDAIAATGMLKGRVPDFWDDQTVLQALSSVAARFPNAAGGLTVFIDEMGKFLESATYEDSDIYFFQELAELASRSDQRLIVVGILHQAFDEYAHRLSGEVRDEWSKVQGRFIDLPINTGAYEQIDLLDRAIESDHKPATPGRLATRVAESIQRQTIPDLSELLERCWPLHPIVSCLLGPISRRRFGQNQRSIFGFLNSSEFQGFQDFLRRAEDGDLYLPDLLWDYLRLNLEPSIMASPDGHRWALAVDALERCQAMGGEEVYLRLLKTIGLVDLFKERSGLVASPGVLGLALPDHTADMIADALEQLQRWSLVVFRKFNDAYSIYEGSDFDIDDAVGQALDTVGTVDVGRLDKIVGLHPIVAKRHYHETGSLRWFDVASVPLEDVESAAKSYAPQGGAIGAFLLAIPTQGETAETARRLAESAVSTEGQWDVVIGLPQEGWKITPLARELLALERVRDETPELMGDRVARLEVDARIAYLQGSIGSEFSKAFSTAVWYGPGLDAKSLSHAKLNSVASNLADRRYPKGPRLPNELLNRTKPSSNAVAAQNNLLRRMVLNEGDARLGIEGFPAEGGLFASLLEGTGLYRTTKEGWRFVAPSSANGDQHQLCPTWGEATNLLERNAQRTVSVAEIYDIWREPPFGVKDGLMPLLAVAFILSKRREIAFYRGGVFQPRLTDLDMDYLIKDPSDIQLRWMNLSDRARKLLSDLADIVRDLDGKNSLADLEPIDVARGLVAIYDQSPSWVGLTQRLSVNAKRVRQMFKQASDPNRLIFDDIPLLLHGDVDAGDGDDLRQIAQYVRDGLVELQQSYPSMLHRLREILLAELQVPNTSAPMLAELRARAENIRQLGGDHRLEAFIIRIAQFEGTDQDMESLAGMAANKPVHQWVDSDIDRASVELASLAQRFIRAETFAHVKGRMNKRHAVAVVLGMNGSRAPIYHEFDISDLELKDANEVIAKATEALEATGEKRQNVILAALAEITAQYISPEVTTDGSRKNGKKEYAS